MNPNFSPNTQDAALEPARFLRTLWPELPADAWLLIYTLPDKASHWCGAIEDAARVAAESAKTLDVYVGMGAASHDGGAFTRATSREITAIPGLWADLDCKPDGRNRGARPPTLEELLQVIPDDVPPTMLVRSGGGYHAYWLFHEPFLIADAADRDAAGKLLKDWQTLLRRRAKARGWALDYTQDLARILRVAGTFNHKDAAAGPRPVTIQHDDGPRYDPDQLREILDDTDFADRTTGANSAASGVGVGSGRAGGGEDGDEAWGGIQIRVNAGACVNPELVEQLCQIAPKFRATWNHDRPDINGPDGGFSEYDLAIANFGVAAGLEDQTIVDMMIEHRRTHGGRSKLRADYYQRTLARAHDKQGHRNGHPPAADVGDDADPGAVDDSEKSQRSAWPGGGPGLVAEVRIDAPSFEALNALPVWGGRIAFREIFKRGSMYIAVTTQGREICWPSASDLTSFAKSQAIIASSSGVLVSTPARAKVRAWWEAAVRIILALADANRIDLQNDSADEVKEAIQLNFARSGCLEISSSAEMYRHMRMIHAYKREPHSNAAAPAAVFVEGGFCWIHLPSLRNWLSTPQATNRVYPLGEFRNGLLRIGFTPQQVHRGDGNGNAFKLDLWRGPTAVVEFEFAAQ